MFITRIILGAEFFSREKYISRRPAKRVKRNSPKGIKRPSEGVQYIDDVSFYEQVVGYASRLPPYLPLGRGNGEKEGERENNYIPEGPGGAESEREKINYTFLLNWNLSSLEH